MKQFLCLFVLLHFAWKNAASEYDLVCPENEYVDNCKNPCQPTCSVPNPPVCNFLLCNKGCVCRKGWLRNEDTNQCVPPGLCPKGKPGGSKYYCPPNQVWSKCGAGCIPTCKNLNSTMICNAMCTPGCVCRRGYVWDDISQTCIPKQRCPADPPCNGPNEEMSDCASYCPPTCQSPCREPVFCPAVCVRDCACKPGYIRDEVTKQCILPEQCPKCP